MSLFKTKEWWQTRCGANESFDRHSLMAAPLFGKERHHDIIVVTSHDGYLRMYDPSSQWIDETKSPTNYKSTDLMIEMRVGDCIVDVKTGKFVSGSQDLRLAVLTDSKLLVYDMILVQGSETEYGDRCELRINYEHRLPRFPASLTVGPFGGVRGRDFFCVQCLDGTLLFYEQEVFAFSQTTRNQLLAEPIVYVSRYDLFVAATSSWILECHRYQSMAEWSRIGREDGVGEGHGRSSSSLEPDWTFNIGEPILGIETVTLTSFEIGIVVLGERHLYCLKDNCASIKYAKRLEYRPVCSRAYVIEPDGKLMVLVIADTGTLMIYEGTTLKWSAQLPFTPVAVARAQLRHLEGAVVVLSADGRLEACYLGSEPSLFVAPPLHPRGYDYTAAERELSKLREGARARKGSEDRTSDAGAEAELAVTVNASMDSADCTSPVCELVVQLSSYAALRDVQVCVHVSKPLLANVDFYTVANLYESHSRRTVVSVEGDWPSYTMDATVVVTYRTDEGVLRAVRKIGQIPIKATLRSCPPEKSSSFVTVINAPSILPFTQLFPEFAWADGSAQRQGWNAVGLGHVNSDRRVTVVSSVANNRYRVQSSDGSSSTLVVRRLIDGSARRKGEGGSVGANAGQNHVRSVQQRMDDHFAARREIEATTNEIGLLVNQLRGVARKMVRIVRERNERSLTDTGLPFLFETTCSSIFARLEDLAKARARRERSGHELRCNVELLLALLRSNAAEDKHEALRAAVGFEPSDRTFDCKRIGRRSRTRGWPRCSSPCRERAVDSRRRDRARGPAWFP
ncbi:hypothetical protein APICC_10079 [Apis cerana cerana]|uniref:Protein PTHB1 n=1 Tax=Apis cerana cerana TaxID=94128 RepID=A0A2A3EL67_APICC|nr:hypothetical protein APICC_10079 [Apis cerana cerana]